MGKFSSRLPRSRFFFSCSDFFFKGQTGEARSRGWARINCQEALKNSMLFKRTAFF